MLVSDALPHTEHLTKSIPAPCPVKLWSRPDPKEVETMSGLKISSRVHNEKFL